MNKDTHIIDGLDTPSRGGPIRRIIGHSTSWAVAAVVGFALLAPWTTSKARGAPMADDTRPQAIAGSWKANCENSKGMILTVTLASATRAQATVTNLGEARQFGYHVGEELMRLQLGSGGVWTGQLHWRNTAGVARWQPITLQLRNGKLDGQSAHENCYEVMERAR